MVYIVKTFINKKIVTSLLSSYKIELDQVKEDETINVDKNTIYEHNKKNEKMEKLFETMKKELNFSALKPKEREKINPNTNLLEIVLKGKDLPPCNEEKVVEKVQEIVPEKYNKRVSSEVEGIVQESPKPSKKIKIAETVLQQQQQLQKQTEKIPEKPQLKVNTTTATLPQTKKTNFKKQPSPSIVVPNRTTILNQFPQKQFQAPIYNNNQFINPYHQMQIQQIQQQQFQQQQQQIQQQQLQQQQLQQQQQQMYQQFQQQQLQQQQQQFQQQQLQLQQYQKNQKKN
jgi:hypothetical protein